MTELFAVIGWNIRGKSASPAMHNASFRKLGINAVYISLDIPRSHLGDFLNIARFNFRGINVTIPHKEGAIGFLDVVTAEARATGAVNTISINRNLLIGYNTDAIALYNLLKGDLNGSRVLILGAGGAARAAAYAAIKGNASTIYISNRTPERAENMAKSFEKFGVDVRVAKWGERIGADVVINATPVWDAILADLSNVNTYVEFVYSPTPETAMVKRARELGIRVIDGVDILVEQGYHAEKIWLGVEPDKGIMKRAVLEFLGNPTA